MDLGQLPEMSGVPQGSVQGLVFFNILLMT